MSPVICFQLDDTSKIIRCSLSILTPSRWVQIISMYHGGQGNSTWHPKRLLGPAFFATFSNFWGIWLLMTANNPPSTIGPSNFATQKTPGPRLPACEFQVGVSFRDRRTIWRYDQEVVKGMLQGSNSICWATGSNKSDMWINVDVLASISSGDVDIQSLSVILDLKCKNLVCRTTLEPLVSARSLPEPNRMNLYRPYIRESQRFMSIVTFCWWFPH